MNYEPKPDAAPSRFQQAWTPFLDAIIITGRAENKSCSEIAVLVGRTRNAVIGRANRLMIQGKIPDTRTRVSREAKPASAPKWVETKNAQRKIVTDSNRAKRILMALEAPPPIVGPQAQAFSERFQEGYQGQRGRLAIEDLTLTTCKFPIDQRKGPVRYCGLKVKPGSSYCEQHGLRCFGRWT